jgi:phage baseplate assembly protein V
MNDARRAIGRLQQRVMLMVGRATLKQTNDGTKMQAAQLGVLDGETRDNVERFQNYGFTSHPHAGAEAAVVFAGGNRDHGLVLAVDDRRYRVKGLSQGEVAIYTDEGDKIVLKRGKVVEITTDTLRVNAATKIELNAPTIELNGQTTTVNASSLVQLNTPQTNTSGAVASGGNASVTGNITATGNVSDLNGSMQEMRDTYNTHKHTGVQTGGGTTGNPNQNMT